MGWDVQFIFILNLYGKPDQPIGIPELRDLGLWVGRGCRLGRKPGGYIMAVIS